MIEKIAGAVVGGAIVVGLGVMIANIYEWLAAWWRDR